MSNIFAKRKEMQDRLGYTNPLPQTSVAEAEIARQATEDEAAWKAGIDEAARKRDYEFQTMYGGTLTDQQANLARMMETERQLAQQQAAGKLGFALSSGPGTSGLGVAAELALNRTFSGHKARIGEATEKMGTQFRLDWDMREDQYSQQTAMAQLQFQHNMALMQQQAELNSASWWEQLGGIVGFGLGLPVGGGLSVAGYGLGQLKF